MSKARVKWSAKLSRRKLDKIWAEIVKRRDKSTCLWCGTTARQMHAHHLYHKNAFPAGRYIIDNGVTLCRDCHFKLHANRETAFLTEFWSGCSSDWIQSLWTRCTMTRGSYSPTQFERDLKDLNDQLVMLGGTTE